MSRTYSHSDSYSDSHSDSHSDSLAQSLTQQLYSAWQQAVANNKLINQFIATTDDTEGRWLQGDAIAFGIKHHNGQNTYYARNLTQNRPIQGAVEEKQIDGLGFTCQFNGYRALRPGGQPKPVGRQADISPDPERCRFSCQNPRDPLSLLNRQPLLQRPLQHFVWRAYYNAAPIDPDGHFLWVPTDSTTGLVHLPQRLSLKLLEDAFTLFQQLEHTLLFFNSLHSGASVNHIHFQAMNYAQPLPAELWPLAKRSPGRPDLPDYDLLEGYPANVMVFSVQSNPQTVFKWIDIMQQQEIPFNLMFLGDRLILIPRSADHEIVSEFPGNSIAALGMCGKIITVDRAGYLQANKEAIESAFAKMTLDVFGAIAKSK